MKYQNILAFEKHLQEAFPQHPSLVYMVITSCDFERKKMCNKIASLFKQKNRDSHDSFFDAQVTSFETVLQELNTQSLFGGTNLVIFDHVDKLKDHEKLIRYVAHPNPGTCLILGASGLKPVSTLYQKGKKETVVLDLSDEKPWDRRRRLSDWLMNEAKVENKSISSEITTYLLDHIGLDMPGLQQELIKLVCYVGDRPIITLNDVKAISSSLSLATGWRLAEGVIWGDDVVSANKTSDLSFLLMFIGQLRYQLQMGYQIARLLDKPEEIVHCFSQLHPQVMDKYIIGARQKTATYFYRGLCVLFDLELASKSCNLDTALLFDRFIGKLRS